MFQHIFTYRLLPLVALFLALTTGCVPDGSEEIELGAAPSSDFSWSFVPGDSNRIVVNNQSSSDAFTFLWDFGPNGIPKTSQLSSDTVFFIQQGNYPITLYISGRGGTASSTRTVLIEQDAGINFCGDSTFIKLLGGCLPGDSASWIFSQVPGAITVGPTPGSSEWFSSPEGGLDPEQYNDEWVFAVDDSRFQYHNQGLSVDPYQGYEALPFTPATDATWTLIPGGGLSGEYRIVIPEGSFIGTMDSGPEYDIISITTDKLVLRSKIIDVNGYFDFYLERKK